MKTGQITYLIYLLTGLLLSIAITSCTVDDKPIDPKDEYPFLANVTPPIVISIKVLSLDGYPVLTESNAEGISAIYRGKVYPCGQKARGYEPEFYGLRRMNDFLLFGELDPMQTYSEEKIIIDWGNASKRDTITFSHIMRNKAIQSFYLNGSEVDGQIVIHKDLANGKDDQQIGGDYTDVSKLVLLHELQCFGFRLFNRLFEQNGGSSTLLSTISIDYILGLIINGTTEGSATWQQMSQCLFGVAQQMTPDSVLSIEKAIQDTRVWFHNDYSSNTIWPMANALFVNSRLGLYAGYVNLMAERYGADYALLDFASSKASDYINQWSNQQTAGFIPRLLQGTSPDTQALMASAHTFKAGWGTAFDEALTTEEDFLSDDGRQVVRKIRMMHRTHDFTQKLTERYTAVRIPINQGEWMFEAYRPNDGYHLKDIIADISQQPWWGDDGWRLNSQQATLALPRFSIDNTHEQLQAAMSALGLTQPFAPGAGLHEISPSPGLYINQVVQRCRLEVNEKGLGQPDAEVSETISNVPQQETLNFNRPFLFIIKNSSETIHFVGTFCG